MPMARALLVVDIQNDYFPGGENPLEGPEAAAEKAASVVQAFRAAGDRVVHMRHVWDAPDALFMRPGTHGVEINERVAPAEDEPVFEKRSPNSFARVVVSVAPPNTATRGPPPNPAATTRSPVPSASKSPTAERAPPRKFGSSIPKKSASLAKSAPR